jgi:hypothetical protein
MQPGDGFGPLRARLVAAIEDRLAAAEAAGLRPEDLGDPTQVAARVAAAIPSRHPTAPLVGACYDESGLVRWLGISRQALGARRRARAVLACRTAEGHWVYPA